jgi:ureidoacrylate peracid hydrolase
MAREIEDVYMEALYPPLPAFPVTPQDAALIVIDVQKFIARPDLGQGAKLLELGLEDLNRDYFGRIDAAIANIRRLLDASRRAKLEVIYIAINAHTSDARDCSQVTRELKIRPPKDSPGNAIVDEIAPRPDEIVLHKITSSAFNSTPLHMVLQNLGKRTLILAGIITNGCVESTARDARDLGYRVIVAGDACATYSREAHDRTLKWLGRTIGNAVSTDEVLSRLAQPVRG